MAKDFGRIRGDLQVPDELYELIMAKSDADTKEKSREVEILPKHGEFLKSNTKNYFASFDRLIDPVIIALFYGLYNSMELPPDRDTAIQMDKRKEFLADISTQLDILVHYLFCLWISKNGFPHEAKDQLEYRRQLYDFLEKVLDQQYISDIMIPYYLEKARNHDPGTTSFLYRFKESGFVEWKSTDFSPEYLAVEFKALQDSFIATVVTPLLGTREK